MCTVTFIPINGGFVITSNRDEQRGRATATPPAAYPMHTGTVFYPRDADAGGTWFAVHEQGPVAVLLNGAGVKHVPQAPYRKSRGLVLLDMIDNEDPAGRFSDMPLTGIEPFTTITWRNGLLKECRWNGSEKTILELDDSKPHIWSSVTLYDKPVIARRQHWFRDWLDKHPEPVQDDILLFHRFTGDGDPHNDLLMNRNDQVSTVSITSLESAPGKRVLQYLDCRQNRMYKSEIPMTKAMSFK